MPVKPLRNLQSKVADETYDLYEQTLADSECTSRGQFVELLLESYLNPKTKTVDVPRATADQLQELQLKDNEIGRLKQALEFSKEELNAMTEESRIFSRQLAELQQQGPKPADPVEPVEGQIILTIPPIMSAVLDIEKEIAEKKSKRQWTIGDLLLNNFWESITNGASHPFRIWSGAELTRLAKQIQEVKQQEPSQV